MLILAHIFLEKLLSLSAYVFKKIYLFLIMHLHLCGGYVHMRVVAIGGQKTAPDPLSLQLQAGVSQLM